MFKKKRLIGLFLVLALIAVMALSACGDDDDKEEQEPTSPPTVAATEEPTEEPTPEPTEEVTEEPTAEPTPEPTEEPTEEAMAEPTEEVAAEEPTEEAVAEETEEQAEVAMAEPAEEAAAEEPTEEAVAEETEEPTEEAAAEEPTEEAVAEETEEPAEEAAAEEPTEEALAEETEEPAEVAMAEPAEEAADEIVAPEGVIDCEVYDLSDYTIGLITDVGQINDKSFNQSSWEGVLAAEACGATVNYIETQDSADYANNIAEFAEQGYDIIVTVGFALGNATLEAAATYPDVTFIGVDQFQAETVENVVGLVFNEDQSGFLAGALAARLTQTGTIAAVLGTDQVPPVVAFKEGYEAGARYIHPDITLISTYQPGAIDQAFTDPEWGATTAKQALDQNADVVFGAGGKTGNGALIEVANAVSADGPPPFCIGVDTDQWLTVPEAHPCLVSSAMKLLDRGVADIIMSIADGTVPAGNFFGDAALAPYHDLADLVPDEVKAEIEEIAAGLADGSISTGYGVAAEEEPVEVATEEAAEEPAEEEAAEEPAEEAAAEEPAEEAAAANNLVAAATADGRFGTLLTVAGMAGLDQTLAGEGPFTVFAPTDDALAALTADTALVGALMADPDLMTALLSYHVVEGKVLAADVAAAESLTTVQGEDIAVSVDADGNVMLNGTAKVIDTDIEADNGVIHAIDSVLLPPGVELPTAAAAEEPAEEAAAAAAAAVAEEPAEEAAAEEAAPEPEAEEMAAPVGVIDCEVYDLSDYTIGLITDVGQINDKSFNQSSWEGVLAAEACGATVNYIETQDSADYANNIAEFAEQGYDIIVTVGFALGNATLEAAATYPDVTFIGVDQFQAETVENVVGLVFNEDQSGFLAGALAARLTQTGTIAAVLGTDQVPPVVAFKEGYEAGARYIHPDITLISTYHPGAIDQAFTDPEWGATTAKQALDQNADVVFGAGGKTGNGALIEVANAVSADGPPPFCIGVDTDQWLTVPEAHPCLVSSAMKLLDRGVADIIMSIADGTVPAGNFFGDAALAPYHDLADLVPDEVKAEIEEIAAGLADGSISTGYGVAAEEEPVEVATEEAAEEPAEEEAAEEPAEEAAAEEPAEEAAAANNLVAAATADGRFGTLLTVAGMAGLDQTLAGEGPFTVFAPTDDALAALTADTALVGALMADPDLMTALLSYHVVEGKVLAADVAAAESLTTVQGEDIAVSVDADGNVMLNGTAKVIDTDIEADNGVIHAIDSVLLPPGVELPTAAAAEEPAEEAAAAAAAAVAEEPAEEAAAEEAAPEPEAEEMMAPEGVIDCEVYDLSDYTIGLITDVGQINDKSFNQSSWEGVLAAEACGATVNYIETQDSADYANNIAEFAEQGYDIIVTVGFALGNATLEAAATYPDVTFIGVDQFQAETVENVVGLVFNEDQSGFLAGALAARLTQTGTIAAVLGTDQVPPVVAFKEGYEAGARYIHPDITLISTYHPGAIDQAFTDPEWGATTAKQALDQNADVVFGAGGKTGNGALIEVANAVSADGPPPFCIGVDTDQWLTVPEAHPCLVSSAMKLLDRGVADIIMSIADGTVPAGNFFGDAALAPYHDLADLVPDEVKAEIEEIAAGLADGSISTGYGVAAEEEPVEVATEEAAEEPAEEEAAAAETMIESGLGVVTVGLNAEYPPFEYVDENGEIVGFDPDLMNAIAERAGFEIEWVNTRWDGIFVALASGEFDAVSSAATITEEREEIVDFSNPYFNAGQMIAVLEDRADEIQSPEDLPGLKVGVQSGTTGDIASSEIDGVEVVRYDEITLAFQALANGTIDAIVNDGPVSADIIAKNPELGAVMVGDPFTDEFYGIAVQPDMPELLDAINNALAELIADGTYNEIHNKWFGIDAPSMFRPAE